MPHLIGFFADGLSPRDAADSQYYSAAYAADGRFETFQEHDANLSNFGSLPLHMKQVVNISAYYDEIYTAPIPR